MSITIKDAPIVKLALGMGYLQHHIAAYFRTNQGRVSEIKNGKRFRFAPVAATLPADFPAR